MDGLWIDMNECANFCDGFCTSSENQDSFVASSNSHLNNAETASVRTFDPRNPPYNINNRCSAQPLSTRTLPVEATYHGGITEYNAHSLYGQIL